MLLSEIPKYINCKKIYNFPKKNISFNFISTNSKEIRKRSLLVVNKKNNFKEEYIKESISKGAVAIITNFYFKKIKIPQFLVSDINNFYILLNKLKQYPPNNIVGVTGTNGKTSVVSNINYINLFCKNNTKSYGTLGYYNNLKKIENSNLTTPEFEILYQKAFSKNKQNNYNFIFEVSSHAISKKRIKNFPINIAAITNISQDHLDFHKTFDNYKKTKFKLFINYLSSGGIAILNDNISQINRLKKKLVKKNIKIISYGSFKSSINIYNKKNKTCIKIFNKRYNIKKIHYNNFEFDNLSCSIGCCLALGINNLNIINAISKIKKPIGRLQEIGKVYNNAKVYVDYAHTPAALKNVLIATTNKKNKPNVLFGCGGDRDKSKRKKMGIIANNFANKIYITDDNPRNENPNKIRKEILKNCPRGIEVAGRRDAIKLAIEELQDNQSLIIAGKGHEKKQIINKKYFNFNDMKIAKFFMNKKNNK